MAFQGKILKQLRVEKGYTMEDLAKLVTTTKGTISNYENGHSSPPNEMIVALADVLCTSTDFLLGRTNTPDPFGLRPDEGIYFLDMEGLTPEDRDKIKEMVELYRLKAKQQEEQQKNK